MFRRSSRRRRHSSGIGSIVNNTWSRWSRTNVERVFNVKRGYSRRLAIELLEDRRLLAAVRNLPGFLSNTLTRNDDSSSAAVQIGFAIDFFGTNYNQLYVNNNGNVTFGASLADWTPSELVDLQIPIIAPFWADVDTRNLASGEVTYGRDTVDGRNAFGVNWLDVGYFDGNADKRNSFQLVIVDRSDFQPGAFQLEFNYDTIEWETGDLGGGSDGFGGASARAGYADGSGVDAKSYELGGAGVNGAFIDSNLGTGLVHISQFSEVPGRYVFSFPTPIHYEFTLDNIPTQHHAFNRGGLLTGPSTGEPLDIALTYLTQNASTFGLTSNDLMNIRVVDQFQTDINDVSHLHFAQVVNDLPVANAFININVTADGRIVNAASTFVPGLAASPPPSPSPSRSILQAVADAASVFGIQLQSVPVFITVPDAVTDTAIVSEPELSLDNIPVSLEYVPNSIGGVGLSWNMVIRLPDGDNWLNISVSATTGDLLFASNWIDDASYNVFPRTIENPNDGGRSILVDPQDLVASPFGWHDTNGLAGAEFTDTRGNNVFSQEDFNANNAGGTRPNGGAALNFNPALNLAQNPNLNVNAAITNLFYMNNVLHDTHYRYGFDEVSGNFQFNNYGNGGLGGDAVQADAQDGSGLNNANFGTPPDGTSPRMQQFIFNLTAPNRDSDLENTIIVHEYGHGVSNRLTGGPANSNALNAVQSRGMGEGWGDWWALMFTQKNADAQNDAYPIGTYVLGQAINGAGIRTRPYSFDMTVNNLTFGQIAALAQPHGIGELWASALWDMNWLLINKYGFEPNIEGGFWPDNGGNTLALQLVMDGLKLQPANPSFLDGRDAILLADVVLTGGENQREIWQAFARRGMGVSATTAGSNTVIVTEAFDIPDFPDEFEANNTIATATVLGSSSVVTLPDLSIHNEHDIDFFKYTAHDTGKLIVRALFTDAAGDIDIRIRDSSGDIIASSTGVVDNEELIVPVVTQQMYFIEVFGAGGATNFYSLEIENFPAPVPTGVHLDPASDTGMMNNDNVTSDTTPTFFIQTDVLEFVDADGSGTADANEIDVLTAAEAQAANMDGIAVEVTLVNTTTGTSVTGFANPLIALVPEVYTFTPAAALAPGVYLVSARTKVFDGRQNPPGTASPAMGRSTASPPLWITIEDSVPTAGTFDLLASSDSGMSNSDNVTNKMQPAFGGTGPANGKVRVFAQPTTPTGAPDGPPLLVGLGVVGSDATDGALGNGIGAWEVTVEPLADDKYNFFAQFENAAGVLSDTVGTAVVLAGTNNTAQPINDNTTITSTINLASAQPATIADVNVTININHAFTADLDIFLVSPSGTEIELTTDNGAVANFTGTEFNDSGTISITAGTNPFTGIFRPEEPLANLIGENALGTWTLRITDDAGGDVGTLLNWSLTVQTALMGVIDTVEPNTPFIDLLDDTGRHNNDNITKNNKPSFSITTTDPNIALSQLLFTDNFKFRVYDRFQLSAQEVLIYDSAQDPAADIVLTAGDMFTALTQLTKNLPFLTPASPGITAAGNFADGVHNLKVEVEDRAGNISHDFFLQITVDTATPLVSFGLPTAASATDGLHATSDTGVTTVPATYADRATSDTTPKVWGRAEANTVVRVFFDNPNTGTLGVLDLNTDVFLGQTVAVPFDGNDAFKDAAGNPLGYWEINSTLDLNQIAQALGLPKDGLRRLLVTAEDVAGNPMPMNNVINQGLDSLQIFIDTQGPQVAGVTVNNLTTAQYDLFDPKPTQTGFTPLVSSLKIAVRDLPPRVDQAGTANDFLYEALVADIASAPGNFLLVGDHVGTIAIKSITVINDPRTNNNPATATIELSFFAPLPDDRYTLTVRDNLVDPVNNKLDGESNGAQPLDDPMFPTGDGVPGGNFVARFTVDSRPEIGSYVSQDIDIDINGNFVWDPANAQVGNDATNVDLSFTLPVKNADGTIGRGGFNVHDLLFAGKFGVSQILVGNDAVFIIDISGSTTSAFGGDPVGDQNNDGTANTVLDAEIAAFKAFNQLLVDRGLGNSGKVSIVAFSSDAANLDMNPLTAGVQLTTTPLADANNNGIRDVDEALRSLTSTGGTNYEAALSLASDNVTTIGTPNVNVIFLSDGEPNTPGAHADEVAALNAKGANTRAFGVGPGISLTELLIIDPKAVTFANTNELLAAFGGGGAVGGGRGFDQLAAYGNSAELGNVFRWIIDTNNDGVVTLGTDRLTTQLPVAGFNIAGAIPVAGNFDGNLGNGDEVGLYYAGKWGLDKDRNFVITANEVITTGLLGAPIVGDFDGDGKDDLAVFNNNVFTFDLAFDNFGANNANFVWGFPGVLDKPVAADMDQDGIDDIGLWVPRTSASYPAGIGEWYFLISNDFAAVGVPAVHTAGSIAKLNHAFTVTPFGKDIFADFGDELALPIVGNFDPPVAARPVSALAVAGDYDGNGLVEKADSAVWRASYGSTTNLAADGNHDGRVDMSDYVLWRNAMPSATSVVVGAGDYNDSGRVDLADAAVWRANFGSTTNLLADGNHNSKVDAADFVLWRKSLPRTAAILAAVAGDYNDSRTVDATDASVWRASFGSTSSLAADGNSNGQVDAADHVVWRNTLSSSVVTRVSLSTGNIVQFGTPILASAGSLTAAAGIPQTVKTDSLPATNVNQPHLNLAVLSTVYDDLLIEDHALRTPLSTSQIKSFDANIDDLLLITLSSDSDSPTSLDQWTNQSHETDVVDDALAEFDWTDLAVAV